jgi:starch synthase
VKVALLTREYPPEVYGGAGVHVEYLSRELARLEDIDLAVHTFAEYEAPPALADSPALAAMSIDLLMARAVEGVELVHSHTWYANLGGHLASLLYGVPHVMTAHSLEPLRPWKAEQLGGGYAVSSFCEHVSIEGAAAVIAVSHAMRDDVLRAYPAVPRERVHVIHNGIDPDEYRPVRDPAVLHRFGVPADRPFALFIGRLTRQKGIDALLRAAALLPRDHQVVAITSAPDTPKVAEELRALARNTPNVLWIEQMPPRNDVIPLLTAATVFVCPSVYEPFGLVNLEAMACETAVVASAVGGIPEIVVDGETGTLVPPGDASKLAAAIAELLDDPDRAARYGKAGRARVLEHFTWRTIAEQTAALYRSWAR